MAFPENLQQKDGAFKKIIPSVCLWSWNVCALFNPFVWEKAYQFCRGEAIVLLCPKVPSMQFAFENTDPRMFNASRSETNKNTKRGEHLKQSHLVSGWAHFVFPRWCNTDLKMCSAVIHWFGSCCWPFLLSVMLCIGKRCGLLLALCYNKLVYLYWSRVCWDIDITYPNWVHESWRWQRESFAWRKKPDIGFRFWTRFQSWQFTVKCILLMLRTATKKQITGERQPLFVIVHEAFNY